MHALVYDTMPMLHILIAGKVIVTLHTLCATDVVMATVNDNDCRVFKTLRVFKFKSC